MIQNEKQPGYGHIKWADMPKMKSISQTATADRSTYESPRRLRAKYTHRTNLTIYAQRISLPGAMPPIGG